MVADIILGVVPEPDSGLVSGRAPRCAWGRAAVEIAAKMRESPLIYSSAGLLTGILGRRWREFCNCLLRRAVHPYHQYVPIPFNPNWY